VRIPYGLCLRGALLPGWTYPSLLWLGCTVLVPQVLTETITPSDRPQRSVLYTSPGQGQGEVKMGGSPRTPKGTQGLQPGHKG